MVILSDSLLSDRSRAGPPALVPTSLMEDTSRWGKPIDILKSMFRQVKWTWYCFCLENVETLKTILLRKARKLVFLAIWMQISLQDQASDAMLMPQAVDHSEVPCRGVTIWALRPTFLHHEEWLQLRFDLAISCHINLEQKRSWPKMVWYFLYGCKILHQLMVNSKHPFSLSHKNYSVECHIYTIM